MQDRKNAFTRKTIWTIALLATLLFLANPAHAALACSASCVTPADVAAETANYQSGVPGAKCLFIYSGNVYQPPTGTISGGMHMNAHACGADVTGIMRQSHINNPNHYLVPYVCAPLCSATPIPTATPAPTPTPTPVPTPTPSPTPTGGPTPTATASPIPTASPTPTPGACTTGQTQNCGSNTGACRYGTQTCQKGSWSTCFGGIGPSNETCDLKDNNCDGRVDENGICLKQVTKPCVENWQCGQWTDCTANQNRSTRDCSDSNACGTLNYMPQTQRTCTNLSTQPPQDNATLENRVLILFVIIVILAMLAAAAGYSLDMKKRLGLVKEPQTEQPPAQPPAKEAGNEKQA